MPFQGCCLLAQSTEPLNFVLNNVNKPYLKVGGKKGIILVGPYALPYLDFTKLFLFSPAFIIIYNIHVYCIIMYNYIYIYNYIYLFFFYLFIYFFHKNKIQFTPDTPNLVIRVTTKV